MSRAVSLASAAALLVGGAVEQSRDGGSDTASAAVFAAGLVTLGAWLAIEVWSHRDGADRDK